MFNSLSLSVFCLSFLQYAFPNVWSNHVKLTIPFYIPCTFSIFIPPSLIFLHVNVQIIHFLISDFSSLWIYKWFFNSFDLNRLSKIFWLLVFSPLWIYKCFFKSFDLNNWFIIVAIVWLFSTMWFHVIHQITQKRKKLLTWFAYLLLLHWEFYMWLFNLSQCKKLCWHMMQLLVIFFIIVFFSQMFSQIRHIRKSTLTHISNVLLFYLTL